MLAAVRGAALASAGEQPVRGGSAAFE